MEALEAEINSQVKADNHLKKYSLPKSKKIFFKRIFPNISYTCHIFILLLYRELVHIFPAQGNTEFCTAAPVRREKD
ncbi:hypothetical protein B1NLA3E_06160 [Bacillus sp. 1NLA3E]|nr:hypothetical protein B1NLA3E_06160 [Bacillus sp. 1NLA3E]